MSNKWTAQDGALAWYGERFVFDTADIARWYGQPMPIIYHAWEERETNRMRDEYDLVAWKDCLFWQHGYERRGGHYVHVSKQDPSKLAYTENMSKGERDIQTQISPGRYLKKFYGDILSDVEIGAFVEMHKTKYCAPPPKEVEVLFASTADEIEGIYLNGPASCMSKEIEHYRSNVHPVRVYGDSDLKLAYYVEGDVVQARCLVRPDTKAYGRTYYRAPENEARLRVALEKLGFTHFQIGEGFKGAHIRLIHDGFHIVGPYIDGDYDGGEIVKRDGVEMIQLGRCGDIHFGETDGYAKMDEDDDDSAQCPDCDGWFDANHMTQVRMYRGTQSVCCDCLHREYFECSATYEWYANEHYTCVDINGSPYCLEANQGDISLCDFTEEYFWTNDGVRVYQDLEQSDYTWASPDIKHGEHGVIYDEATNAYYVAAVQADIDARDSEDEAEVAENDVAA